MGYVSLAVRGSRVSGLISRRFGWYGLVWDLGELGGGRGLRAGGIVAQPSALAISVRDSASSSAASARSRRALPNQGA